MWTILLVSLLAAAPPAVEVQTLGGEPLSGVLVELGAKQIAVQTAKGRTTLEIGKLVSVSPKGAPAEAGPSPSVWFELIDGSSVVGTEYSARQGQARVVLSGGKVLEIPTQNIHWVRLQAQSEPLAAEWSKIVESQVDGDLLVARKGDSIDFHKGVLRDVSDAAVSFDLDGELLAVKRPKVYGLVYFHRKAADLPEAVCRITDATGAVWAARSVALAADVLTWTTPTGLAVTRPLAEVTRIDFSQGKIVYLADLKPESSSWTPYFATGKQMPARNEFFAPRTDKSLSSGPMELNGKPQLRGLALHSRTHLVYRLPGRFQRFKALVGIDDRVRPNGHVRLVIQGDDRVLLETTVAGTEAAKPVDLDLTGVRRLSILVDFGENLDVADHLDLAEEGL
jgi:hypothetical protein